MKILFKSLLAIIIVASLQSCAFHGSLKQQQNRHEVRAEVALEKGSFKAVKYVSGKESVTYIFGIGGLKKDALISEARRQMYAEADLTGSQVIINEQTDVKHSVITLLYRRITVTVSGYVYQLD
jgi:hypothetical protein